MKLDGILYPEIENAGYRLPQGLHQSNPSEVGASPLGGHHHLPPDTRRIKLSSPEGCLYNGNELLLVLQFGAFLPRCRAKPYPEVFFPHAGRASGAI